MDRDTFGKMYNESGYTTPKGFGDNMLMGDLPTNTIDATWTDASGDKHSGKYDIKSLNEMGVTIYPGDKKITVAPSEDEGMVDIYKWDEATQTSFKYQATESEFQERFGDSYPDNTKTVRIPKPGKDTTGKADDNLIDLKNNIKILGGDNAGVLGMFDDVEIKTKGQVADTIRDYVMELEIPDGGFTFIKPDGEEFKYGTGKDMSARRLSLYNGLVKFYWDYKENMGEDGLRESWGSFDE